MEATVKVLEAKGPLKRPFIVADPEAMTIAEMIGAMREGLGRRPGLFPLPKPLLAAALKGMGRSDAYQLLSGSLMADSSALRCVDWVPVTNSREGLAALMRREIRPKDAARERALA